MSRMDEQFLAGVGLHWHGMPPTFANGKICYLEMPAIDIARSAEFYKRVFGWNTRRRGDGSTAFDDTTGQVSGTGCSDARRHPRPAFSSTSWSTT